MQACKMMDYYKKIQKDSKNNSIKKQSTGPKPTFLMGQSMNASVVTCRDRLQLVRTTPYFIL